MYCPKCRMEYIDGMSICSDCGLTLVSELPPIQNQISEFEEYDEVLTTFNPGDIAIIKSLLDSEDIDYYFKGEFFNYAEPLVQPARLMVRTDQTGEAMKILKDIKITYTVSSDEKSEDE